MRAVRTLVDSGYAAARVPLVVKARDVAERFGLARRTAYKALRMAGA